MATYYVRTDGNNGNAGTTDSAGGAWADPGYGSGQLVTGDILYIKNGTYSLTTTTVNIAGGPMAPTSGIECLIEGYDATAGDLGTKPVIDCVTQTSFNAVFLDGVVGSPQVCRNIKVDGQDQTGVVGFQGAGTYPQEAMYELCDAVDCVTGFNSNLIALRCTADGGTTGFNSSNTTSQYAYCVAKNNSGSGFSMNGTGCAAKFSVSYDNNIGFLLSGRAAIQCLGCIAYSNTSHGFDPTYESIAMFHCVAVDNGGYGFETIGVSQAMVECAGYNNTSGDTAHTLTMHNFNTLTADPFVDGASFDFNLNETAGGGQVLRDITFSL